MGKLYSVIDRHMPISTSTMLIQITEVIDTSSDSSILTGSTLVLQQID
jgi:hypothetical protein